MKKEIKGYDLSTDYETLWYLIHEGYEPLNKGLPMKKFGLPVIFPCERFYYELRTFKINIY
jgi:hypothetical protein